jgi:hypothetical protein
MKIGKESNMLRELDTVVLKRAIPEHGLEAGDIGAIVYSYDSGKGLEVEFVTGEGRTVGVVTLKENDVRLMHGEEILHARELRAA